MKKLLALVLALVMTLGLATVGTNAAVSAGYKDADKINDKYAEAIDVMNAIGVFEGDKGTGTFRPTDTMKRSEVAKVVAVLMYDKKTADAQQGTGRKYNDLPASHWAAGYMEMLTAVGVLSGMGDGTVAPDKEMRTIDYAKMLLVALGFGASEEGLVGPDYQIHTNALANQVGLFAGNNDVNIIAPVTREEAALYAFNAIKSPMVHYTTKGSTLNIGGVDVTFGGSDWTYMTTTEQTARYRAINNVTANGNDQAQIVEFAEQHFPGLRCEPTTDWAGRPSTRWSKDGLDIGTYVRYEYLVKTYTEAVTGAELAKDIGEAILRNCDLEQYWNGADVTAYEDITRNKITKANTTKFAATGKGVCTELYEIPGAQKVEVIVVSVETFYGYAAGNFDADTGNLSVGYGTAYGWDSDDINVLDCENAKNFKQYDNLLVNLNVKNTGIELVDSEDTDTGLPMFWTDLEGAKVVNIEALTDVKEGVEFKEYSRNDKYGYNYGTAIDGTKYNWNYSGLGLTDDAYNTKMLDLKWNLYFDKLGYVVYAERPDVAADPFVFVSAFDTTASHKGMTAIDAVAIFTDGVMKDIKVDASKTDEIIAKYNDKHDYADDEPEYVPTFREASASDRMMAQYNHWFTYKVNDGVYTLTPWDYNNGNKAGTISVPDADTAKIETINPSSIRLNADDFTNVSGFGNGNSVYITVKAGMTGSGINTIKGVTGFYKGIQNIEIRLFDDSDKYAKEDKLGAGATSFDKSIYFVTKTIKNAAGVKHDFIVAAICFGEELGTGNNFVFATEAANKEYKDGNYYYWDFKAVVNGEEKMLTCKGNYDEIIALEDMIRDQAERGAHSGLFQMTHDADGYVRAMNLVKFNTADGGDTINGTVYTNKNAENDAAEDKISIKGFSAVDMVFNDEDRPNSYIFEAGNALYYTYVKDGESFLSPMGVALNPTSGKVFLRQWTRTASGTVIASTTVFDSLDKAIKATYGANDFEGEISAVLDRNGVAQWIVIKNDRVKPYNDTTDRDDVNNTKVFLNLTKRDNDKVGSKCFISNVAIKTIDLYRLLDTGKWEKVDHFVNADKEFNSGREYMLEEIFDGLVYGEAYMICVNNTYFSNPSTMGYTILDRE